jgi:molecular chaperone DnaK (HSP70)
MRLFAVRCRFAVPRLQVTFNVDSNGILEVTAEAPGLEMKLFNEFNDIY